MQVSNCFIVTNTHSVNSIQSIKHSKIKWNLLIKYSLPATHLIKHIICLCINDKLSIADGGKRLEKYMQMEHQYREGAGDVVRSQAVLIPHTDHSMRRHVKLNYETER